jgi:hypothetical protein
MTKTVRLGENARSIFVLHLNVRLLFETFFAPVSIWQAMLKLNVETDADLNAKYPFCFLTLINVETTAKFLMNISKEQNSLKLVYSFSNFGRTDLHRHAVRIGEALTLMFIFWAANCWKCHSGEGGAPGFYF